VVLALDLRGVLLGEKLSFAVLTHFPVVLGNTLRSSGLEGFQFAAWADLANQPIMELFSSKLAKQGREHALLCAIFLSFRRVSCGAVP